MDAWFIQSEPYQQFMEAHRCSNASKQAQIIDARLAVAGGAERAFWLRVRANQRARSPMLPHIMHMALLDLDEALRSAPDDADNLVAALVHSMNLCVRSERMDRVHEVLAGIRRESHTLKYLPFFWQNAGLLHMRRRRWHQAFRAFSRALGRLETHASTLPHPVLCYRSCLHLHRSLASFAGGKSARAAEDLAVAQELGKDLPPANVNYVALALAEAELEYSRGALQEARAALQKGLLKGAAFGKKPDPWRMAEIELFAARLARAEGNTVGFQHFCQRALDICNQHTLPLSAAAVQAVMAGAER